jgi:hydrogenase maturation protein HypF
MERRAVAVQGVVQGVGFRPFVYGLASRLQLCGFVKNRSGGVLIEVEGDSQSLNSFLRAIAEQLPSLAHISAISWESRSPQGERAFRIETSDHEAAAGIFVSPDVAVCEDCLRELFDPADRRYLYPFLNCTNCGPRLTIIRSAPYDRVNTTMLDFAMCLPCRKEYEDPANRRFHAQPTACPKCGPQLDLRDGAGRRLETNDPLASFAQAITQGKIGAVKGLGGYHLVCDASNQISVNMLRFRKHRDEKPFALMVRDLGSVRLICWVSEPEAALLTTPAHPIVLLQRRRNAKVADGVAPGNPCLGVMLPYTPLHHLLMRAVGDVPLVMTSGNRSDEPIAYEDGDALSRLNGIADLFLMHNRPIQVRCEDSVTRIAEGCEMPVRRSRGYAPAPLSLPVPCPGPILATGGQLKATFALGRDAHAFISQHLGDLDDYRAYEAYERDIARYEQLFETKPRLIAHDMHPEYASTLYARRLAEMSSSPGDSIRLVAVQHHHAHMASCMAENGLTEPVIGVTFDGTGYGPGGTIWGGEFLVGDYRHYRRMAHLRPIGMPGGDQAIREPWRLAVSHLRDAGVPTALLQKRIPHQAFALVEKMLGSGFNTPMTTSAGRLFDAVAALAGIRDRVSYEGQAAMELEWQATKFADALAYPFELNEVSVGDPAESKLLIDTRPLIREVANDAVKGATQGVIGRRFHTTMVEIIAEVCAWIRRTTKLDKVVLSGGVFMNVLLTVEATRRLEMDGFRVYRHRLVPANDGGLSLGQLCVVAASI